MPQLHWRRPTKIKEKSSLNIQQKFEFVGIIPGQRGGYFNRGQKTKIRDENIATRNPRPCPSITPKIQKLING